MIATRSDIFLNTSCIEDSEKGRNYAFLKSTFAMLNFQNFRWIQIFQGIAITQQLLFFPRIVGQIQMKNTSPDSREVSTNPIFALVRSVNFHFLL